MNSERDHDHLLENALKHQLRPAGAPPASDACLDAEAIAAWMDGGLDPQAVAMAEVHAASCARCQALLGTVARTTPVMPVTETPGARLWRWWFAPVAAAAAAATIWMVVPQDWFIAPPTAPSLESSAPASRLEKSEAMPPAAPPPAADAPSPASRAKVARDRANTPASRAEPGATKPEAQSLDARERSAEAAKLADTAVSGRIGEAAPAPVPPSLAAPPPAAAMAQQARASADEPVMARSAPSANVVWQVGRAGLVELATDGRTFVRLQFPEAVDLTAVTATDERRAVVTTADGRAFETADAGKTWRRQ